jgi:hypothetical protein
MRLLKCAISLTLAVACLIGLGAILTARSVSAVPLAGVVPVTTTIQAAINAAQNGDTILIPAGTFTESLTINKSLTLTGVTSATTIIRAVPNQRVITVTIDHDLRVEHLAIVGGRAGSAGGGGILIDNGRLQLIDVLVADNWANYGGGIYQDHTGRVDAINSRFERNHTDIDGGGLYVNSDVALTGTLVLSNTATRDGGGLTVWTGNTRLTGGRFEGNQAGRNGGGLNVNNSLTLNGTAFITNTANQDGGGVLQWNSNQIVVVSNGRFERNFANRNGGGLAIAQGATTTITSTLFLSNTANSFNTTNTAGGGLYFDGSGMLQINASTFRANRVDCTGCSYTEGGGARINALQAAIIQDSVFERNNGWDGGGLYSHTSITIRRVVFRDNTGGYGAGAQVSGSSFVQGSDFLRNAAVNKGGGLEAIGQVHIAETRFISNTGGYATGGLHLVDATARLTNTVIANNRVYVGGGLYVEGSVVHALHTTIVSNTTDLSPTSGVVAGRDYGSIPSTIWLTNTVLATHTIGITVTTGCTATLNGTLWFGLQTDYSGNVSTAHDVYGNPLLAADRYHLTAASLNAIDQGVNSGVPIDIDGDPRPSGSGYDLGADEYRAKVYLPLVLRQ